MVTSKEATFEAPPRGPGFTTLTLAVSAVAMSDARMFAFNCAWLTNVVVRGLPFQ